MPYMLLLTKILDSLLHDLVLPVRYNTNDQRVSRYW